MLTVMDNWLETVTFLWVLRGTDPWYPGPRKLMPRSVEDMQEEAEPVRLHRGGSRKLGAESGGRGRSFREGMRQEGAGAGSHLQEPSRGFPV